jgi:hypothetical protein
LVYSTPSLVLAATGMGAETLPVNYPSLKLSKTTVYAEPISPDPSPIACLSMLGKRGSATKESLRNFSELHKLPNP